MGMSFQNVYFNRRVLVTGHTGFKGSWLTYWLRELGAKVMGFSLPEMPSQPALFEILGLEGEIQHRQGDVRDLSYLESLFKEFKPEIVFHLAAQPITLLSYEDPQDTFAVNFLGTVNVLECLRRRPEVMATVLITSDKCYENQEWIWGYRENDRLGGKDPYSASKGAAELAISSYMRCFFSSEKSPWVASARAGNVIGGGDWAKDRIVPDLVRAFSRKLPLQIRSPKSTRPWQHVLEPLSGYLTLGQALLQKNSEARNQSFNFGPSTNEVRTVEKLIQEMSLKWPGGKVEFMENSSLKEARLLSLNCDKAHVLLKWHPVLRFEETVKLTMEWYLEQQQGSEKVADLTSQQIHHYTQMAKSQSLPWA